MIVRMRSLLLMTMAVALVFAGPETVQVVTTDGKTLEGVTKLAALTVSGRKIPLGSVLSVHNGAPATSVEAARIEAGLTAIQAYKDEKLESKERQARSIRPKSIKRRI